MAEEDSFERRRAEREERRRQRQEARETDSTESAIEDETLLAEERQKRDEERKRLEAEEEAEEKAAAEKLEQIRREKEALRKAEEQEQESERLEEERALARKEQIRRELEEEERREQEEAAAASLKRAEMARRREALEKEENEAEAEAVSAAAAAAAVGKDSAPNSPAKARARTSTSSLKKDAGVGGLDKDAADAANKEWNKSAKKAVEGAQANDPTYTIVNLSENTVFAMKHSEYCEALFAALETNTHVTEVHLKRCALSTFDMSFVSKALQKNKSIKVLDLENNKIDNNGAIVLADGLRSNSTLIELNLLGQGSEFGDPTLTAFIQLFDYNVTLTKVIWRLNSRKSFAINKLIVRNNTIKKWVNEGKSVKSIFPANANLKDLSLLMEDGKVYTPKVGADEPEERAELTSSAVSGGNSPVGSPVAEHRAVASSGDDSASEKRDEPKGEAASSREEVGKLDANAMFAGRNEPVVKEEKVVGKLDSASVFSQAKKEEEKAQREVGKLKVDEVFAPSEQHAASSVADRPQEIGKLSVEARYRPTSVVEVKPTVEKPEKIGKLNAAEKFKPVSQVEVKRTVEDLPAVGKLNLRPKSTTVTAADEEAVPKASEEEGGPKQPGKLDVLSRYKPPAMAEAQTPPQIKDEVSVGKINVAERYKVTPKADVSPTVEKPEVKKMNVADRFKPVSQIEVKRTVEVGESVGKLQVSAPESHLEVVKQVPQAGSLEDLIAMDVRDEESARKAKEAKDEESAARKAKKRFEEEEAKRAEEAREKELQRKREEEAKARKAEKAERAAAEQRLKEEAEKKEAERREAEKIERAQQHQQVEAAAENGDHAALLLAKQKALELAQQWLAEEENRHAKTTAALQASEKEKSAAVAEAKREREQREHAEAEGRKASQQLAEMGTEMANHVAELEREIARLKAEVATQKTEISKLSGELASAKAAPPPAAAVAAASASEIPKFSSWKEFFVLAGLPEEAASEYATLFEDAAIELSQAVDLTKDELAELEVPMGHRMKILKLIKQPQKE